MLITWCQSISLDVIYECKIRNTVAGIVKLKVSQAHKEITREKWKKDRVMMKSDSEREKEEKKDDEVSRATMGSTTKAISNFKYTTKYLWRNFGIESVHQPAPDL